MKKKQIGWTLLGVIWGSVALRALFPGYLYGITFWIDRLLVTPPWFLLQAIVLPEGHSMLYLASTAVYLIALSALLYRVFIGKIRRQSSSKRSPKKKTRKP